VGHQAVDGSRGRRIAEDRHRRLKVSEFDAVPGDAGIGLFDREIRALLTAARWSAASSEEVLATAARVRLGDPDSWVREWTATGGAAWSRARGGSDATAYLHAASYYGAALALIAGADDTVDETALWRRQRDCWDRAVALMGGERLAIPYELTSLPAYFFSGGSSRRPLVIIDHGGRMTTSEAWAHGGAAAHACGYHWMTFDGPGRQAALLTQRLVLRPDWEAVIAPVARTAASRADVDARRMALIGLEHAGYGVPRALATVPDFAAAAVAPGIVDASRPWLEALPDLARVALIEEDRDGFELEVHLADLFAPETNRLLRRRGRWYELGPILLYDLYQRIRSYALEDAMGQISTPMLVCGPYDERRWPGQADALHVRLLNPVGPVRRDAFDDAVVEWLGDLF
jgi:hypothetical protein